MFSSKEFSSDEKFCNEKQEVEERNIQN